MIYELFANAILFPIAVPLWGFLFYLGAPIGLYFNGNYSRKLILAQLIILILHLCLGLFLSQLPSRIFIGLSTSLVAAFWTSFLLLAVVPPKRSWLSHRTAFGLLAVTVTLFFLVGYQFVFPPDA